MSEAPYRPELGERVRVRRSDEPWIVLKRPPAGGYVVGPADGGPMRRIVAAADCEPWRDAPADEPPCFTREEVEAALGDKPRAAPPWAMQVIDRLLAEWRAAWEQQPEVLHGVALAANLAATVAARWVLAAEPALLAELVGGEPAEELRSQAIGTLAGVVLPVALQQLQQQPT